MRLLILAILSLFTVACGLTPTVTPTEHYYRLSNSKFDLSSYTDSTNLHIQKVSASGIYNERAILYRNAKNPLEIHRYNYHYWSQTPAELIKTFMQIYLQKKDVAKLIYREFFIKPEIIRFERLINNGKYSADVAIKMSVNGFSKIYYVNTLTEASTMHSTVEAFNISINNIMGKFITDLSNNLNH